MRRDEAAVRVVKRLDAAVSAAVDGVEEPIVAFSGGLGSLIVAALARKRCDLACVVVGLPGSSDLEAAKVAQMFLDYPVAVLQPTPAQALHAVRSIAASDPRLSLAEVLALAPLVLVEQRHRPQPVLSGFGLTARSKGLRRSLQPRRPWCPGLGARPMATRAPLVRLATALGLPESFALAAPHAPVEGSGIGPALRAMALGQHISLSRLVTTAWTRS